MSKGISTNRRVTNKASCLRQSGVDFVCRYYSHTTQQSEKRLTPPEAAAILQAGMSIVTVYEDGPTSGSYFNHARGVSDALHAHASAQQIPQPMGTAIYFAVDYDANSAETQGPITDYFRGVTDGLAQAAGGGISYQIGVYGSGRVCQHLKEAHGLVRYSWLAESTGWAGSGSYSTWNIKQAIASHDLCGLAGTVNGDYEDNQGAANIGSFGAGSAVPVAPPPHMLAAAVPAAVPAAGGGGGSSVYASRLTALARQQYDAYHQFDEAHDPLRTQIRAYWEDLGFTFPGVSTPWSAVFISWCVRTAGASDDEFKASTAHSRFVHRTIQNELNNAGTFRGRRITDYRPKAGDILHNNRGGQNLTYDFAAAHQAYESHSAIIVEVASGFVLTIGGNESDSIGVKRVELNAGGFIRQRDPNPYICIIADLKS